MLMSTDEFPARKFSDKCYTHKFGDLVAAARLEAELTNALLQPQFESAWQDVADWSEQKRYYLIDESEAKRLYEAISDSTFGVFPWIKTNW